LKIKSRIILTIVSSQLLLLIIFGAIIFHYAQKYNDSFFIDELEHRADVNEKYMLEKSSLSKEEYKHNLEEFVKKLPDEKLYNFVAPYKDDAELFNHKLFPKKFIEELLKNGHSYIRGKNHKKIFGKEYSVNGINHLIIISVTDKEGSILLNKLKKVIIIGIASITLILFIISFFLSESILKPIKRKIYSAMDISSSNLHKRIQVDNPNDEIGQLAIAFNKMLDRLEESFKLQSSFISNASHEIKNPLTMITGTAEIALLKDRTVDEYKKTLESILQDSDSLNSLVKQLFTLAKTDTSYPYLAKEYILLTDILKIIRDQNDKLYPKKIIVISSLKSNDVSVYGNFDLLISAFQNIIDNAIKFSEGKEVIIETIKLDNKVEIKITDNGPGVKESEIEKISHAFFRSESVRNIEGHGIGLALTKKIIELHDGSILFENRKISKGLIVIIRFPLK